MSKAPNAVILRAPKGEDREISAESLGLPTQKLGVPCYYYERPMVSVGEYWHPKLGTVQFSAPDLADADHYTREFIKDGGKPYLPITHKGEGANQGFLVGTRFDGQTLHGTHQYIGDASRENAAKYETSVCLRRGFKGGNQKTYPIIVEHNALVANPVAMGLGDYVALSRDGGVEESVPVFIPSAERNHDMTPEQVLMAREILGETETPVTDDNALDMIFSMARTARDLNDQAEEASIQLSRATEEVTDLRAMLDKANGEVTQLSRSVPRVVDPEALTDRADAYMSRVELGVANGDIPPFIATGLKGVVLPKGKPSAYMLSRSEDFDGRPIDIVLDLFKGTGIAKKLAALGEQSGPQNLIPMSRTEPGTGDAPAADLPFKRMAETYNAKAADAK